MAFPLPLQTTYDGQKMRIFTKHEWRIMPNGAYAATAKRNGRRIRAFTPMIMDPPPPPPFPHHLIVFSNEAAIESRVQFGT